MSFSRRTFLMATGAAALAPALARAEAEGVQLIPLDMSQPRPTARLRLDAGMPVTAIFDTGAAASVIMMGYAQKVGLPEEGPASAAGPGGKAIKGFRTTIAGSLGEAEFGPTLAVAMDIPLPLPGVSAIMSPRVFAGRLVRFHFADGEALVMPMTEGNLPSEPPHPYSGADSAGAIRSVPAVSAILPDGLVREARVDTGWAGTLGLPYELAETLPLKGALRAGRPMRRVGIQHKAWDGRLEGEVRLGGVTLSSPEVVFLENFDEVLIGMEILRATVLTLDPGGLRTWLSPS